MSDTIRRALYLFSVLGLLVSQSGCFTVLTATACAASQSGSGCGTAIAAAATVDAVLVEAALESSSRAGDPAGYYDECIGDSMPCEDDPNACCYEE